MALEKDQKVFRFCSDSPKVMNDCREMLCGKQIGVRTALYFHTIYCAMRCQISSRIFARRHFSKKYWQKQSNQHSYSGTPTRLTTLSGKREPSLTTLPNYQVVLYNKIERCCCSMLVFSIEQRRHWITILQSKDVFYWGPRLRHRTFSESNKSHGFCDWRNILELNTSNNSILQLCQLPSHFTWRQHMSSFILSTKLWSAIRICRPMKPPNTICS